MEFATYSTNGNGNCTHSQLRRLVTLDNKGSLNCVSHLLVRRTSVNITSTTYFVWTMETGLD